MSQHIASFTNELVNIIYDGSQNYRGITIKKGLQNKYEVGFKVYDSIEAAKAGIDDSYNSLSGSIQRSNQLLKAK